MTTQVVILRFGGELCSTLREVEKCQDGIFQRAAKFLLGCTVFVVTEQKVSDQPENACQRHWPTVLKAKSVPGDIRSGKESK